MISQRMSWTTFCLMIWVELVLSLGAILLLLPNTHRNHPQTYLVKIHQLPPISLETSLTFLSPSSTPIETPTPLLPTPEPEVQAANIDTRASAIYRTLVELPLANEAESLVEIADLMGIDWRLMPAIGLWESTGGKKQCAAYNPFGYGRPCVAFESYRHAMVAVATTLTSKYYANNTLRNQLCIYKTGSLCDGKVETETYVQNILATMRELELAK